MENSVKLESTAVLDSVLTRFKYENNKPNLSDVTFHCDDGTISCTRLLLAAWSVFWRQILIDSEVESHILFPGINKQSLKKILNFQTTGKMNVLKTDYLKTTEILHTLIPDLPDLIDSIDISPAKDLNPSGTKEEKKGFKSFKSFRSFKSKDLNPSDTKEEKKDNTFSEFDVKENYICTICTKYFSRKEARDNHMKNIHYEPFSYTCNICGKKLSSKNGLETHMKSHEAPSTWYKCKDCEKKYKNKTDLLKHCKAKSHAYKEKPKRMYWFESAPCHICNKKILNDDWLKHLEDHKNEKIECSHCSFKTDRMDSLYKHERQVHKLFNRKIDAISKAMESNKKFECFDCKNTFDKEKDAIDHITLSGCKEFKCDVCDKKFSVRHNLLQHIREIHELREEFNCPHCGRKYHHKRNLTKHLKSCKKLNI